MSQPPSAPTAPSPARPLRGVVCPISVKRLLLHAAEASTSVRGYLSSAPRTSEASSTTPADSAGALRRASEIAESLGKLLHLAADLIKHEDDNNNADDALAFPSSLFLAPLLLQMRQAQNVSAVELNEQILAPRLNVVISSPAALLRLLKIATDLALDGVEHASVVLHTADAPAHTDQTHLFVMPVLLSSGQSNREAATSSCSNTRASAESAARQTSLNSDAVTHAQHTIMWLAGMLGVNLTFPANRSGLWRLSIRAHVDPAASPESQQ